MSYLGDFPTSTVVYGKFTTVDTSGLPTALSGSPALSVYKDDSTTESTTGVTLTASLDGRTGMNQFKIDLAADTSFYNAGHDFQVVVTTGTVGGSSVVGYVVGEFSIQNRYATAGITAAAVATAVWQDLLAGADFSTVGSIGKLLKDNINAAIGSIPTANQNADALLTRDWTAVAAPAARSVLNALRFLRNRWVMSGGTTVTVYKEDDSTVAWTGAVTTSASDPVDSVDPA